MDMKIQDYCKAMLAEVTAWKEKLDDLFGTIGSSVDRAWRDLSPGEVGG